MAIAPAIISHYHHRHKNKDGKVGVGHFVGGHPMNHEKVTLKRALLLALLTGLIWSPWYAWERVREAVSEVGEPPNFMLLVALMIVFICFVVGMTSRTYSLSGFVRKHKYHDTKKKKEKEAQSGSK